MSTEIEQTIEREDWEAARGLIITALHESPDEHWLLTRLGLAYYEERRYKEARQYAEQALAIAPDCPLVLWDYAGTLEMLDHSEDALRIFQQIVDRGIDAIAYGECGEGVGWARGLIVDCHYRMAHCYQDLAQPKAAKSEYEKHLMLRGPGARSIYPIAQVRKELADLTSTLAKETVSSTR